tara:strand:+ start:43 stop:612 length:570 start_codon:yes stop_codon:yes gene_type:complete
MVRCQSAADKDEIINAWDEIANQGLADIEAEGIPKDRIRVIYVADMRYLGEGHEVQVTIPDGLSKDKAVSFAWEKFHDVHNETFGFHYKGEQDVEIVNLRVQAIGEQYRPKIEVDKGPTSSTKPKASRPTYWDSWIESPIYDRTSLQSNQLISGPAIIEEYGSTIVVPANWSATRDDYGNLVMKKEIGS